MISKLLDEASELIYGDREQEYGDPAKNLSDIALAWGVYRGVLFTSRDVCMMMALVKIMRDKKSPKRDNPRDVAGYMGLTERVEPTPSESPSNLNEYKILLHSTNFHNTACTCAECNKPRTSNIRDWGKQKV